MLDPAKSKAMYLSVLCFADSPGTIVLMTYLIFFGESVIDYQELVKISLQYKCKCSLICS